MSDLATAAEVASARATESEGLGRLADDVVDALRGSEAFRIWVPEELGGLGGSVHDGLDAIETLASADGATGWCTMIANTTALAAHHLDDHWGRIIYGDPRGCTGGFAMPAGTATLVDGGLRVTGTWSWGSGSDHCTWIGGGVRVVDHDGEPATTADGCRAPFVFFDAADVELLGTWQVAGLKATHSTDYAVREVFVPEGRWAQLVGRSPRIDDRMSRFSTFGALAAGVASVSIGLARRSCEELVALGGKRPAGSSRGLAERAAVQAELAIARAEVGQAHSHLRTVVDRLSAHAADGEVPIEVRAELRGAATAAVATATRAVDRCYHAAGGTAVYETSALQRVFRDAHVATQHAMTAPRTNEVVGRVAFGLPTDGAQL